MPAIPAAYVGLSPDQLAANLAQAQAALQQLRCGVKVVTASYAQGDGARSVTYDRADLGSLQQLVNELAALVYPGQGYGRRRPLRMIYT